MKTGRVLLDVNVLLALTWPNHLHHASARTWFRAHSEQGWATASVTEAGFIRISSNPRVFQDAVRPRQALEMLRALKAVGNHQFWADCTEFTELATDWSTRLVGHRQVTDLQLLRLAVAQEGVLATFDSGVRNLLPEGIDVESVLSVLVPGKS